MTPLPLSSDARAPDSGATSALRRRDDVVHRRPAAAVGGDEELEVVRAAGAADRVGEVDPAAFEVPEEGLVEGLHAVVLALGDDLRQLAGLLGVDDHVPDPAGHAQDLAGGDAALAGGGRHEALGDDALQGAAE